MIFHQRVSAGAVKSSISSSLLLLYLLFCRLSSTSTCSTASKVKTLLSVEKHGIKSKCAMHRWSEKMYCEWSSGLQGSNGKKRPFKLTALSHVRFFGLPLWLMLRVASSLSDRSVFYIACSFLLASAASYCFGIIIWSSFIRR